MRAASILRSRWSSRKSKSSRSVLRGRPEKLPSPERLANELLQAVHLPESVYRRPFDTFSTGEQHRAEIARIKEEQESMDSVTDSADSDEDEMFEGYLRNGAVDLFTEVAFS